MNSAEKRKSDATMDGRRGLKSVVVCPDGRLDAGRVENLDTCSEITGTSLPEKSSECILSTENDAFSGSKRVKRKREGGQTDDSRRNSVDESSRSDTKYEKTSRHDGHLLSNDETYSKVEDMNSRQPKKRRRNRGKRKESSDSACEAIFGKGLEKKSSIELLEDTEAVARDASAIPRAVKSLARKKLLILDLNGLLCDVVRGPLGTYKPHKRVGKSAGE